MDNKFPVYIKKIMRSLTDEGFEAYVVGGAVRDLLLGIKPGDFDIATNAKPENVIEICHRKNWKTVDNLGRNFGCVNAVVEKTNVEITTFRGESYGSDAHRPEQVWYCETLQEDCNRRDFTVNAMALDITGRLYDFYDGQADLKKRLLRTVGCAQKRYEEDALRMFRACRFVGQLGFTYVQDTGMLPSFGEPGTPYYLPRNYVFPVERCASLSLERVRRELDKLLLSSFAGRGLMLFLATGLAEAFCRRRDNGISTQIPILPELCHLEGLRQNPRFHKYNVWEHTLTAVDNSPKDLVIRWALLLHDIGKGLPEIRKFNKEGQPSDHGHESQSALMAETILNRLGYQKNFIRKVVWLVASHMRFAPMLATGEKALFHWIRTEALSGNFSNSMEMAAAYNNLVEVFLADMGATNAGENSSLMQAGKELGKQVTEIARTKMPVAISDLNISGHDLLELLPESQIHQYMILLLERVQSGNLPNEKTALMAAVKKYLQKGRE